MSIQTRWKNDHPPSLEEFTARFPDDFACAEHLAKLRWPKGFVCPHCRGRRAWRLEAKPWVWECAGTIERDGERRSCRRQTSVIAGTFLHGSHLPLRKWFIAAYLVTTHSNGISALQLQAKIQVTYKTAWLVLHKLRRAMVAPDRKPLAGLVEVDETSIPFRTRDEPPDGGQGRSEIGKIFIAGAVERLGPVAAGRVRLAQIERISRESLQPFVEENTAPGAVLLTDGNKAYVRIPGRTVQQRNLSATNALPAHISLPSVHRIFSNFKRWVLGTYHGLGPKHFNTYAREFEFRWNRRRSFDRAMDRLFQIGLTSGGVTRRDISGDTTDWYEHHFKQIRKMLRPELRLLATLANGTGVPIWQALDDKRRELRRGMRYRRSSPERAILPLRRAGDRRITGRRYARPAHVTTYPSRPRNEAS